jgi:hypothetical protein
MVNDDNSIRYFDSISDEEIFHDEIEDESDDIEA